MPRPTKLNESTVAAVEQALMQGYNVIAACHLSGISTSLFYEAKARGRRESERLFADRRTRPRASESRFLDIFERFSRASVHQEMLMLYALNRRAVGGYPVSTTRTVECIALPGGGIFEAVTTTTTYAPPDGRAAIWLLERRWPEKWGRRRRKTPDLLAPVVGMTLNQWRSIKGSPTVLPEGD